MIPLPKPPKVIEKKDNRAVFEIEGLYPGYGITIGNSLRRVLLSSLEGAAITQVKIKGVQHEFSTIPGILEDVLSIVLNLKQVRCKMYSAEPQKMELAVKGVKEVKASDFKAPSQIEIINKDVHIANLTSKNASLEMEVVVERGIGYIPAEQRKKEKLEIGTIALDAIFSPVRKVAFRTENMRVGERTDFNRLFLEVETDGTMSPEEAVVQASEILVGHFSIVTQALAKSVKEQKKPKEEVAEDPMKLELEKLKLSTRTLNALLNNNLKTIGGVVKRGESGLLELEGLGKKGVKEIKKALKEVGVELK